MALKPGDLLGPYALQERLGSGGFGSVWRATRVGSLVPIPVAVKIGHELQSDADNGADAVERLLAEARTWVSASGHRNVVPVQDAGVWDGHLLLVSELMTEGSLRSRITKLQGRPMPTREAVELALGILAGLEHLHRLNIVHRDLKPENILLQQGDPRITDFGISRFATRSARTRAFSGTLQYLSPDAFENRVSFQMDIWAVGVILYELLTGHLPFAGESDAQVMHAILTKPVPPMSETVSPAIRTVVMTALERDLTRRYSSAAEFRRELEAAWRPGSQGDERDQASAGASAGPDATLVRVPVSPETKRSSAQVDTADKPTVQLKETAGKPENADGEGAGRARQDAALSREQAPPETKRSGARVDTADKPTVRLKERARKSATVDGESAERVAVPPRKPFPRALILGGTTALVLGGIAFSGMINPRKDSSQPTAAPKTSAPTGPVIETKLLTPARRGAAYRMTLVGKAPNPVWSWNTSAAPPGLSLSSSGEITGTPTRAGDYQLSIRLTTQAGGAAAVQPMPLRVLPPESVEKKVSEAAGLLKRYETEANGPNANSRKAELTRMVSRADSLLRDAIRTDPDFADAWYHRILARFILVQADGDWKAMSTQALRKFTEPRFTDQRLELSK